MSLNAIDAQIAALESVLGEKPEDDADGKIIEENKMPERPYDSSSATAPRAHKKHKRKRKRTRNNSDDQSYITQGSTENTEEQAQPVEAAQNAADSRTAPSSNEDGGGSASLRFRPEEKQTLFDDADEDDDYVDVLPVKSETAVQITRNKQAAFSVTAADKVLQEAHELMQQKPYCRVCAKSFESKEDLMAHRETDAHVQREAEDRKQSYCAVCEKQFTSPSQRLEHERGKWHKARVHGDTLHLQQPKRQHLHHDRKRMKAKASIKPPAELSGRLRAKQAAAGTTEQQRYSNGI